MTDIARRGNRSSPFSQFHSLVNRLPLKIQTLQWGLHSMGPIRLDGAHARLAGGGGLLIVRYRTSRPIRDEGRAHPHIIDQRSGRHLHVQRIPFIGNLASQSAGRSAGGREGYFVIDNSESIVGPGSKVTVVVGELCKEDVVVSS